MRLNLHKNKIWCKVKYWGEIFRQRRALGMLSDDLIKDIGISRVDAEREANRPCWDNTSCYDDSLRKRNFSKQDPCIEQLEF